MPIMSQMTCNGSGPANSLTASAVPSGCLATMSATSRRARSRTEVPIPPPTFRGHAPPQLVRDQSAGAVANRSLDTRHHLWGERSADDGSQPLVPRVVEHDHRAEVFGDLRGLVVDRSEERR